MNWFRFLKNKSGKLKFGLAHLVAIGGVGMVLATTAFNAEKEAVQEQKVRSITSLAQGSSYGGMRQTQGGLTSINVGNAAGYDGVANSEERARIEAARSGGDFGLNAADNMDGRMASRFSGRAAETSETEGLGMGRNATDIVEAPTRGAAADITPGSMGDRTGRTGRGRYGAGDTSSATTQTLSTASMARASGSGISASYGGGSSGSSSGGAGGSGSRGGRSSGVGEGYHLSGAMPSGTNIVSMSGAGGRGASQFTPGAANARVGRGSHSNAVGDALKDISKRSADAAANKYRSANEGARAFLSGSQNSGGIGMDTLAAAEASTDDFHTPEKVSTGNLNKKMDDETARQKEKNKDTTDLTWLLIGFAAATVACLVAAAFLLEAQVWWLKLIGYLLLLFVVAFAVNLCWKTTLYANKWGGDLLSYGSYALAALGVGGAIFTALKPSSVKSFIQKHFKGALKWLAGQGLNVGGNLLKTAYQESKNSTDNDKK